MGMPLIGITCGQDHSTGRVFLAEHYYRCIDKAGGVPILLPPITSQVKNYLKTMDGLLLSGGTDVDPQYFQEEPLPGIGKITPDRDQFEIALTEEALSLDMPILAICRGIQVLNIAAGGGIYQDLYRQQPNCIEHRQQAPRWHASHSIKIDKESLLFELFKAESIMVNSFHHQAIHPLAEGFRAIAKSSDGIIEAVQLHKKGFVVGVQWHPECMVERYPQQQRLFDYFVRQAKCV